MNAIRHRARPAIVICLAMVLAVGLISGMTALLSALVTPIWVLTVVLSVVLGVQALRAAVPPSACVRSTVGLRAPPSPARRVFR